MMKKFSVRGHDIGDNPKLGYVPQSPSHRAQTYSLRTHRIMMLCGFLKLIVYLGPAPLCMQDDCVWQITVHSLSSALGLLPG